jgi:integrase
MPTLQAVIDAYAASSPTLDRASFARLDFWREVLGDRELVALMPEHVDDALVTLAERGRLRPRRGQATEATGQPYKGATLNRYLSTLGTVFKYARRLRLIPRGQVSPTRGLERAPEPTDPERYLRPEEVERLLAVARVVDRRWRKLPALITLAFHTGLRVGNLTALRWRDVDLVARTASVARTKNGAPIVAALTAACIAELKALPGQEAERLVFAGKAGRVHAWRRLWERTCTEAGLPGRNFHQLRHGCGSALASAGVGQAQIMAVLGHRTLTASARYMHSNVDDRRAVVDKVFG